MEGFDLDKLTSQPQQNNQQAKQQKFIFLLGNLKKLKLLC